VTCVRIACLYCEKYPFKNKNTKERTLSHTPIKSLPSIFLKKKSNFAAFPTPRKTRTITFSFSKPKTPALKKQRPYLYKIKTILEIDALK
jgi:hypothetical protein